MQLYGLKTCDTCKKALRVLPNAEFVDVRGDGVPGEILVKAIEEFGAAVLNSRSTTWRGLTEQERASEPIALLKSHPALMKRPLIVTEAGMYLGWTPATQTALGVL